MGTAGRLELVALQGVGRVEPGDDLAARVLRAAGESGIALARGDVLVIAQKVVSKAEGRYAFLDEVMPSPRARELAATCLKDPHVVELVLRESRTVLRAVPNVLVVEDRRGLVLANAGIDQSNVEPDASGRARVLLLPEDPDASAKRLRQRIGERAGIEVGVIINDSIGRAWRLGTVGSCIGASGLPGLLDLRGTPDLYGRALQTTETGFADELAAAASFVMGQGGEGRPVILIRGAVLPRTDGNARELLRPGNKDLFR
ncbi:MAG: coenzyme F420-0:L-glutamate ligase [Alphaproteobacteria bacterium]|nr:coenzyme F420-0:L-glutamate ligase [Alphaproteobacteria bacterium]